ncbi:hypothetical protein SAMN05216359_108190 [Roseateles sp. YR242]|nr:hypothetical protein SAMN05216359_108190 [Roseateles sp. YR242]
MFTVNAGTPPGNHNRIQVGLCGESPPSDLELTRRIAEFQKEAGGAKSTRGFFLASRGVATVGYVAAKNSIRIEGRLDASTPGVLSALIATHKHITSLEINSFGGDARAAYEIANIIRTLQLDLEIGEFCMSACANYLIPNARTISTNDSVIGFHGSPMACYKKISLINGLRAWGIQGYLNLRRVAAEDRQVLAIHPRYKTLIELSQRDDRGAMDNVAREWLIAPPETLSSLGINIKSVTPGPHFKIISSQPNGLLGKVFVKEVRG